MYEHELLTPDYTDIFMNLVKLQHPNTGVQKKWSKELIDRAGELDSREQQLLVINLAEAWALPKTSEENISPEMRLKALCVFRDTSVLTKGM